jgi:hypothetical protein
MTTTQVETEQTGWIGWVVFGGVMMAMLAAFHGVTGFAALFKDDVFVVGESGMIVEVDYSAWGWVHLGLAGVLALATVSLLAGHMFGRIMAVVLATISAVANLAFLPAQPIWSAVMIALDVLVIYAVVVHGRELQG